jgi:hypothetical protein
MATSEERLKILQMISEGKISASEGSKLLEALNDATKSIKPDTRFIPDSRCARFLHVRVTDTQSGKTRVNVHLPVGVINAGIKVGARFSPEIEGINKQQLMQMVNAGECGQVADVVDEEDHEHVEVFLEP